MDRPFYDALVHHHHPAARWWLAGDVLLYLGMLPTLMGFSAAAVGWPVWMLDLTPDEDLNRRAGMLAILGLVAMIVGLPAWSAGGYLKDLAHVWGRRDGIREEDGAA